MSKPASPMRLIFTMLVITVFSATVLAVAYKMTKGPIEDSKHSAELEAIKQVIVTDFNNNPFAERVEIGDGKIELFPARLDGTVTSIAIKTSTNSGYGGRIELVAGFMLDGTLTGYRVISHNETPGLGTKAWEGRFFDSLIGQNASDKGFMVRQDGGDIDAVTGATITSRAIINALRDAHETYAKFIKRGINEEQ